MKKYSADKFDRESGVALVAVLVMLSTVSLLVMSMCVYSQLAGYGIRNDADVLRSRYVAEGAMNRVIWLIAADNNENNTRDLLNFDYKEYEDERFIPDGRVRELDYYGTLVKYRIENGMGGLSIERNVSSALNNLTRSRAANEEDLSEAVTIFNTRYTDYTDTNDLPGEDGMESEDYQEIAEEVKLPRNKPLQYREELWYIPEGGKFFPPDANGRMTMINPLGMGSVRNQKPDLLQANYALLTNYANLSHDDALETLKTIKKFKRSIEPDILAEEFDPLLLATLQRYFACENSGYYRITIENASSGSSGSVRMDATYRDPGISNQNGTVNFFDWLIY